MKTEIIWQRIEGALIFVIGLWAYTSLGGGFSWWQWFLAFFAPDLGFAGYLLGRRVGAFVYNFLHIYVFGLVVLMLGSLSGSTLMMLLGAMWFAHAGFDRMLGYGLKTDQGFRFTHLGQIGRKP
ncbi:MAG: DUF4260 family protein [Paracoccus denitrificans]|uniref:DUF4260 family protein n=1 Tax=Paracoccus denitrificans TaxID=266 RepID=A0A533IDA0_PARDE|nr:MAG: DUF4260 family protein [Paracoccus denitrificans]